MKDKLFDELTKDKDGWWFDKYHAYHTATGLKFWVANGFLALKEETTGVKLGLINSIMLCYWLDDAKIHNILNRNKK